MCANVPYFLDALRTWESGSAVEQYQELCGRMNYLIEKVGIRKPWIAQEMISKKDERKEIEE